MPEPQGQTPRRLLVIALLGSLASIGLALAPAKSLREYGQQSWQSGSGLPQNSVHAMLQTRNGFLWIGTEAGLVRFDGSDFATFDRENTPRLPGNSVNALVEDPSGALWISTTAGLARYEGGVFRSFSAAQGLPSRGCLGVYLTRSGRLLALTTGGVASLAGASFHLLAGTEKLGMAEGASLVAEDSRGELTFAGARARLTVDADLRPLGGPAPGGAAGELRAIAATADNAVWLGGANGLFVSRRGAAPVPVAGLPGGSVTALLAAPEGNLWVGTEQGLAVLRRGAVRVLPELRGVGIERLFQDREGSIWATGSSALARILPGGAVELAPRRLVPGNVLSILEDREGSLWFGTETAGLHLLRDQAFATISAEDGLRSPLVRAVFEDHAGTVWVGESEGGLDRILANGAVEPFAGPLPSRTVLALAETHEPNGAYTLWAGTPAGLVRVGPGNQTRVFTTGDGLADDFVRSLYADRDGSIWIGTRNGLTHSKGESFRSYSKLDGLGGDLIGAMLRTRDGKLWVGTIGGLSRMEGDGFVTIAQARGQGESRDAVTALLEDHRSRLWVGVQGSGLQQVVGDTMTPVSTPNLPQTIYGMLEDSAGNLWLSSRTGVDRVSGLSGVQLAVRHYDTADGMRIREASGGGHPAAWAAADGRLWFATLDGVAAVRPGMAESASVAPLTAIEQIEVDEQPAPITAAPLKVQAGQRRLTIHYAGLSFAAPGRVRYRYRLVGLDRDWIDAGSRRTSFYTNVPPGRYRFQVMASSVEGAWSAPAEMRFEVQPFFYQTRWFYALVALGIGLLSYLAYRRRVHLVSARYQAVFEERGRIAREIHDTLAQGFVAVSVQLELAERLLASSTEAAAAQLRQTKEMVRESLSEARSSIWNLRSTADGETLPARLAAHVAAAGKRLGGHARPALRFAVHGAYRALARSVENEILRVAQEAIANAITHAGASVIEAALNYDPELLELRISDDGVGLGPGSENAAARGHFGLQGMRERAARIGAELAIGSPAVGRGTGVTLQLDLRRKAFEKGR